jgi:hypothetical protein
VGAFDDPRSPVLVGWRLEALGAELVFCRADPESVLLALYRRLEAGGGLHNRFRGILWFVEFLIERRARLGVRRVVGAVDTSLFRAAGGLDDARLFRFYVHCGTRWIGPDEMPGLGAIERRWHTLAGTRWACIDFERYRRPTGAGRR